MWTEIKYLVQIFKMYSLNVCVDCFGVFFAESKLEGCWVLENFPSFSEFWESSDNVVDR